MPWWSKVKCLVPHVKIKHASAEINTQENVFFKGNFVYEIFLARMQTFEKVRIFGSPCCVPRLRRKQPIECLKKFCVRILKGMSKGSRACVNFEGKIRTQNFLKVNSELYTT